MARIDDLDPIARENLINAVDSLTYAFQSLQDTESNAVVDSVADVIVTMKNLLIGFFDIDEDELKNLACPG